jgi:serine/threonine-protein kinase
MTSGTERLSAALADRYRIERRLGEGDLKHDRKVAVKVLRPELAAVLGADRFVQEIKTTANLQHPHILPLFDSGEADSFLYYVMPYVEGETLRSKLDRETQLGIDESVRITSEIADALDYAHRQGVIHRDIKPENILLHDGRPMVADFGIALAVSAAAGGRMTETGLSLGTPHYMSPEQATAEKDLTARADIYSLGSVLYEMLTGHPPHVGSTAQQIIMKIVTDEARPITELRKSVPPQVADAVAVALEKLPADRFESANEFAGALQGTIGIRRATASTSVGHPHGMRGGWAGWIVGAIGVVAALVTFVGSRDRTSADAVATQRHLSIVLPDTAPLAFVGEGTLGVPRNSIALSTDGKTLIYAARVRGKDQLYRRDLTDPAAAAVAGTEGAFAPFVSPDGAWIGFFAEGELRKVPLEGGSPVRLTSAPETAGADWGTNGDILMAVREGWDLGWVSGSGGTLRQIPNPQEVTRSYPSLLPDGEHALVVLYTRNSRLVDVLGVTNLRSGHTVALTVDGPVDADSVTPTTAVRGWHPQYLASGHLVYVTYAGLVTVAFDHETWRIEGNPVEVLPDVNRARWAHYVVSDDGTLYYADGGDRGLGALVWASRGGVDSLGFEPQHYGTFDLSPDGQRIVAQVFTDLNSAELWVYDVSRGTQTKVLTRGRPLVNRWWLDGRRVVFSEASNDPPYESVAVRQLVESGGERDTLVVDMNITDVAADSSVAVGTRGFGGGAWILPLQDPSAPIAIDAFRTAWGPTLSPDQRWIAYTSNESGQYEVYVTPTARLGERRKVSLAGGEEPLWTPGGDRLIYRWGQEWFSVTVPNARSTDFGRPEVVVRGPYLNVPERSHDLGPDGRHLLVLGPLAQTTNQLNVVTNWVSQLTGGVNQ